MIGNQGKTKSLTQTTTPRTAPSGFHGNYCHSLHHNYFICWVKISPADILEAIFLSFLQKIGFDSCYAYGLICRTCQILFI